MLDRISYVPAGKERKQNSPLAPVMHAAILTWCIFSLSSKGSSDSKYSGWVKTSTSTSFIGRPTIVTVPRTRVMGFFSMIVTSSLAPGRVVSFSAARRQLHFEERLAAGKRARNRKSDLCISPHSETEQAKAAV